MLKKYIRFNKENILIIIRASSESFAEFCNSGCTPSTNSNPGFSFGETGGVDSSVSELSLSSETRFGGTELNGNLKSC